MTESVNCPGVLLVGSCDSILSHKVNRQQQENFITDKNYCTVVLLIFHSIHCFSCEIYFLLFSYGVIIVVNLFHQYCQYF